MKVLHQSLILFAVNSSNIYLLQIITLFMCKLNKIILSLSTKANSIAINFNIFNNFHFSSLENSTVKITVFCGLSILLIIQYNHKFLIFSLISIIVVLIVNHRCQTWSR
jgi:hypothetical protein